jgi:hypothetical protein
VRVHVLVLFDVMSLNFTEYMVVFDLLSRHLTDALRKIREVAV